MLLTNKTFQSEWESYGIFQELENSTQAYTVTKMVKPGWSAVGGDQGSGFHFDGNFQKIGEEQSNDILLFSNSFGAFDNCNVMRCK